MFITIVQASVRLSTGSLSMPTQVLDTDLPEVKCLHPQPIVDERGSFTTVWDTEVLNSAGLNTDWVQANRSVNHQTGTLRGLHCQLPPAGEVKLVRCVEGAIWDVAVDIRPQSPTYKQWVGLELTKENSHMAYVPIGFAHGFITLQPNTVVEYLVSHLYAPQQACSLAWNDAELAIDWPAKPMCLSPKDADAERLTAFESVFNKAYH